MGNASLHTMFAELRNPSSCFHLLGFLSTEDDGLKLKTRRDRWKYDTGSQRAPYPAVAEPFRVFCGMVCVSFAEIAESFLRWVTYIQLSSDWV